MNKDGTIRASFHFAYKCSTKLSHNTLKVFKMFTFPERGIRTRQIQGILMYSVYFWKPWGKYITYSKLKSNIIFKGS